jgi:hypothetical protein
VFDGEASALVIDAEPSLASAYTGGAAVQSAGRLAEGAPGPVDVPLPVGMVLGTMIGVGIFASKKR